MTIDLKESLLNLIEKGEKGYTKDIEKLDKFAEEMHEFATKDKPEIPLAKSSKDDVNRFFRIHSDSARVKDFIVNNDYKKPFLHASKEPTVDKRDTMVHDLKKQVREDTHDAKRLLESKPELFNSKEKGELNKLFSDMDKQGGIEKHFEKSFGLQVRDSRANEDKDLFLNKDRQGSSKDASEQVKSFKSKSSKDGNQLFSDKDKQSMAERFGSKSKFGNKAKEIANDKDVKPIFSGNSSPKLNAPSKSIGGR